MSFCGKPSPGLWRFASPEVLFFSGYILGDGEKRKTLYCDFTFFAGALVISSRRQQPPPMNHRASFETLLTVSLPEDLYSDLVSCQQKMKLDSVSAVVRAAIVQFDFAKLSDAATEMRQISFRISAETRGELTKQARRRKVSLGHLIRAALRVLPENANLIPNKDTQMPPKTVKKAVAKKAPAKKVAAKAPAKKAVAKKAPAKKVAVKKAPAKKAVAKKAPAKKVVVKKAPAKKAPVKKVVAKKAPAKKVVAKKAPAKKAVVKKAPAKKVAKKK